MCPPPGWAGQPRRECPVRAECPLCAWRTSPTAQAGDFHQSKWNCKLHYSDHPQSVEGWLPTQDDEGREEGSSPTTAPHRRVAMTHPKITPKTSADPLVHRDHRTRVLEVSSPPGRPARVSSTLCIIDEGRTMGKSLPPPESIVLQEADNGGHQDGPAVRKQRRSAGPRPMYIRCPTTL